MFPARTLTRVGMSAHPTFQVTSKPDHALCESSNYAYVMLAIFSEEELTVTKSTILGVAEEISEPLVDKISTQVEPNAESPIKPPRTKKNEDL